MDGQIVLDILNMSMDDDSDDDDDDDESFTKDKAYDYVRDHLVQLQTKSILRKKCILQPKDTKLIYAGKKSLQVIEPQYYDKISTLDKNHFMFSDDDAEDGCRGHFSPDEHGNARSGSGIWYKVCPELIAFCNDLDLKVRALSDTSYNDHTTRRIKQSICDDKMKRNELKVKRKNMLRDLNTLEYEIRRFDQRIETQTEELAAAKRNIIGDATLASASTSSNKRQRR